MTETPIITAIAPWFGGKRTMAPQIVAQLGTHRAYWEPFCGSMAVLLAKPECSQETVSDLHGDLINLAKVIRDPKHGPALYRRLRRTLPHEGLYREAAARFKDGSSIDQANMPDVDRAYEWFISSWLGRNGVIGTRQYNNNFCVRFTMNGGIQGTRFRNAVNSIPAWRRRLAKVTILKRDGFELLERIEDQAGVAIYADPPYLRETRKAKNASASKGGSALYVHDFEPADHERLAKLLHRFRKARVVVSYYDHARLSELYPRWSKIDCSCARGLAVQGRRGSQKKIAPEVLLVNGEPFPMNGAVSAADKQSLF